MKVYRCNCADADRGTLVSWHANKAAAERALRDFQRERDDAPTGPEGVHPVEIPTNKAGLLAWLNANFDTDNV